MTGTSNPIQTYRILIDIGRDTQFMDNIIIEKLIDTAISSKEFSYSPYSKFRVGAAVLTKSGMIYGGCNVENASYGGAICAERTAFVKALSQGDREFIAVAVSTDLDSFTYPCGFCRQFMVEFGEDILIYVCKLDGSFISHRLGDLIPHSFGPKDLKKNQTRMEC